jgi:arylformamidase
VIWDISPLVEPRTAVWPGDTPFSSVETLSLRGGDSVNLSEIRLSCHMGAHADAPSHYLEGEPSIEEMPLEAYLGPCSLIDVRPADREVRAADLGLANLQPRVLLRTQEATDSTVFPVQFTALSVELVERLAELGVVLVGLDSPSVDVFDSTDLPVHKSLHRCRIANLECLQLDGVPTGDYELVALPLRLQGRDASPVRAVLRSP